MGEGMERMGGRLREWGDDAGLKVERAGRSERRWLEGNRQNADDDYDAALYDVDYAGPQRMRDRRQGAGGVRRKRIDKRLDRLEAKIHPERRHGRMEEDEEEERMGKWKKAEMKLREKERDSEGEGGWWSWWGGRKDKREDEEMKSRPHYQEKKFGVSHPLPPLAPSFQLLHATGRLTHEVTCRQMWTWYVWTQARHLSRPSVMPSGADPSLKASYQTLPSPPPSPSLSSMDLTNPYCL